MTKEDITLIVSYSKGLITKEELFEKGGAFGSSLLLHYLNDKNSSNLRQMIVCDSIGLKSNPNKLGYDAEGTSDEVKPKNVLSDSKKRLDCGGNYTDLTWKRHKKYLADKSIIHIGGFVDGNLIYIIRVPYSDLSGHFESILTKKLPHGDKNNTYVRSASFGFKHVKNCTNLHIEFVRNDVQNYRSYIHKDLYNYIKSNENEQRN